MSDFTPGPWQWRQCKITGTWELIARHSGMLLVLDAVRKGMQYATFRVRNINRCLMVPFYADHPDARLIAAAPDLYEALDEATAWAVSMLDTEEDLPNYIEDLLRTMVRENKKALAKAEGKNP